MIKTFARGIAVASLSFAVVPAVAQDEPEQPRTTYRIEYVKFAPDAEDRWMELGDKYYGPAADAAGQKRPTIHWLMSGPWDVMMVLELPRGMATLDSHNPPERTAFRKAFIKIAGSEDEAKKIWAEGDKLEAESMTVYSHTHP